MRYLLRSMEWILESTARTFAGLSVLTAFFFIGFFHVSAATTYNVHNLPDMTLATRINTAATNNIVINWPRRNSIQYPYPTTTGGVLEFSTGTKTEHIYYSRAINNSTNKTFALTGTIIRNLDWNNCDEYVSDGAGQLLNPGTKVRLVPDCRLFNFSLVVDRVRTMIGSGAIKSIQTNQPWLFPNSVTTSQRDAFTYGNDLPGIIYNSTLGVFQGRVGGTWQTFAASTGTIVNASETVAGKVELGSLKDQSGSTLLGETGAPTVVQTKYLTGTGGLSQRARIPYLSIQGILTGSILGTGNKNVNGGRTHVSGTGAWVADAAAIAPASLMPTGAIIAYSSTTPPSGYVLADGRAHTRTGTGAALFAVLGTTFGAGNGSTTFNVPDLRGRVAVSPDGGVGRISANNTLAAVGGTNDGSHTHTVALASETSDPGGTGQFQGTSNPVTSSTTTLLPPYLVIQYIIKN